MQAADVKTVLRVFSIEVTASEKDQLDEEGIVVRLRKVRLNARWRIIVALIYDPLCSRLAGHPMTVFEAGLLTFIYLGW